MNNHSKATGGKKNSRTNYRINQNKKIKCFSLISTVLFLAVNHLCLPRMPSNTRLVSGPAVGTAQTLSSGPTPECSCLQCPQLPESGIFFCGDSHSPFIHSIHTVCPPDCVGLICSLYSWWKGERFSILFLSHNAPEAELWFYPHL